MLAIPFLEGVSAAFKAYKAVQLEFRFQGLEHDMKKIMQRSDVSENNVKELQATIQRLTQHHVTTVRGQANKMLAEYKLSNVENIDIITEFVLSVGCQILAVTFSGKVEAMSIHGADTRSSLITASMDSGKIINSISILAGFKQLLEVTIVTNSVDHNKHMREIGYSSGIFMQVAKIFGFEDLSLTDHSSPNRKVGDVYISFEGTHSLVKYNEIFHTTRGDNTNYEVIPFRKKNVYLIGPNGSGKSTWANHISNQINHFQQDTAEHTTLVPSYFDIDQNSNFQYRLWDMPGLFDGTEEAADMEDYMNTVIVLRQYFAAAIFVFHGSTPSSEQTKNILNYAIRQFGNDVKKSFIAIVNDFDGRARMTSKGYADKMSRAGFVLNRDNFIISSGRNADPQMVRAFLSQFGPKLVNKYKYFYNELYEICGNNDGVISELHEHGLAEMIRFRQNERFRKSTFISINGHEGYFSSKKRKIPSIVGLRDVDDQSIWRNLGLGKKSHKEEVRIKLHQSCAHWSFRLDYTFPFEQKRILNSEMKRGQVTLINAPSNNYEYVMIDFTFMSERKKGKLIQALVSRNIISDRSEWIKRNRSSIGGSSFTHDCKKSFGDQSLHMHHKLEAGPKDDSRKSKEELSHRRPNTISSPPNVPGPGDTELIRFSKDGNEFNVTPHLSPGTPSEPIAMKLGDPLKKLRMGTTIKDILRRVISNGREETHPEQSEVEIK